MGGFATYAQNIRLEHRDNGWYLLAKLARGEDNGGGYHDAETNLDDHLSNNDGHFQYGPFTKKFGTYAQDVRLSPDGKTLHARLAGSGGWMDSEIDLNGIISNKEGRLEMDPLELEDIERRFERVWKSGGWS